MASIFVIGSASLDRLHINGQTYLTAGGAGLYTALAVSHTQTQSTLFAPCPRPMPDEFIAAQSQITWIGPTVEPAQLSRLEIAHHGDGKATLVDAAWGATEQLSPSDLPDDLSSYHSVHIAALPSAQRQLDFLRACRERNASTISVGTYARIVYGGNRYGPPVARSCGSLLYE